MKKCGKCKKIKEDNLFFKNRSRSDGLSSQCKECNKLYHETESGKDSRKRWNRSEKKRKHNKRYTKTASFRLTHYKRTVDERRNYPDKWKARDAVSRAVRNGKLPHVKMAMCAFDSCSGVAQEYHHSSYHKDEWLDVIPYCSSHHKEVHRMEEVVNVY